MKSLIAVLSAAVIFSTAFVADAKVSATTLFGILGPNETKTVRVHLPEGTNDIEVYNAKGYSYLNCDFTDVASGFTGLSRKNVYWCYGFTRNKYQIDIDVSFTNLSQYPIEYKVVTTPIYSKRH